MLVKNFHWVIIEDSETKTKLVANLLKESTLKYTHLNVKTLKSKHSTVSIITPYSDIKLMINRYTFKHHSTKCFVLFL